MKSKNKQKTLQKVRQQLTHAVVDIHQCNKVVGGNNPWVGNPPDCTCCG